MVGKIVALGAVFLLALAGTVVYLSRPAVSDNRSAPEGAYFEPPPDTGSEVRISEADLGRLVRRALEGHPNGRRALALGKELRTEIEDGRVEIGIVINLSEIPPEDLEPDERETIDKVTGYLPFLEEQDLYLAVSGVPTARDGKVAVERDLRVKIAFLSLPIAEMGELLGVDTAPLEERLLLDLSPFRAHDVEVLADEVVIRLTTG